MGSVRVCLLVALWVSLALFSRVSYCDTSATYGPGLGADSLANTVVGGVGGNTVSYRFRAQRTASVQSVLLYLLPDRPGYSAGTGGQIEVDLVADDSTPAHNPSTVVLASYVITNAMAQVPSRYFPVLTFATPPALVAGQLYHIVFTNIDPSPAVNYLSVDALYQKNPPAPVQPTVSDVDLAVLLRFQNGAWAPRAGYTPIFQLTYSDGSSDGVGYMEAWVGAPQNISGTSAVRETITVSGAQRTVTSVAVRIAHVSGSDPLIVRLENGDGTVVEQGTISADSVPLTSPASYNWATYTFASAHALVPGQTYNIDFEGWSSSTYQVFPIRKGYNYGFQNTTYFPDGFAQFTAAGSDWVGWTQWGVANRSDGDLQFYFGLVPPAPPTPVISNALAATSTSATITWATDEPSTSQVQYGTSTSYGGLTSLDSSMVTDHSVTLNGLTANTAYHYSVISTNALGGQTVSGDLTFATQ
jgi:hypothetical protein